MSRCNGSSDLSQVRNPYPPNVVPARSLEEEDYVEAVSVDGPDMETHYTPNPTA